MARIILGSYAVRFPVGGYLAMLAQWLLSFRRLGHEVYCVEKSGWSSSCYDASKGIVSDDCSYGVRMLRDQFEQLGLQDTWCFVDSQGRYHGLSRPRVEELFRTADLFVETVMAEWYAEAAAARLRVLLDGDPGITQIRMEKSQACGEPVPEYDYYYTTGKNVGTSKSMVPTAGKQWRPLSVPVVVDFFPIEPSIANAPFTTVMNWKLSKPLQFNGVTYGGKDMEFDKFQDLPRRTSVPLEIAVDDCRRALKRGLADFGWRLRNSFDVSLTIEAFRHYISASKGEFSVCKNVFVATHSGWFGDRSAAYLASGRPVVMQDTGFSEHLPCGQGLFAVRTAEQAAAAIEEIQSDYGRHSKWARDLAAEHLSAEKILGGLLSEVGI